jgi:hypothetical protein
MCRSFSPGPCFSASRYSEVRRVVGCDVVKRILSRLWFDTQVHQAVAGLQVSQAQRALEKPFESGSIRLEVRDRNRICYGKCRLKYPLVCCR